MKILILMAIIGTAAGRAQDKAKPDPKKKILDALQGKWALVLLHDEGRKSEVKREDGYHVSIKGNKWIRSDGEEIGVFEIDASATPATIDLRITGEGAEKGRTLEGIVEVAGDTMRWCFYLGRDKRRPTVFPQEPDPDILLYGYRRPKDSGK